jgi:hypothetical protein
MDANTLAELEHIYERDGELRTEAVVEFAKDATTALHAEFEWDDALAAHQHRLWKARALIRAAVIIIPTHTAPQHVYVHVGTGEEARYLRMSDVIRKPDLYRQALSELERRVIGIQRSVDELITAAEGQSQKQQAQKLQKAVKQLNAAVQG